MGWQSYFILYTNEDEKQKILQAIEDHNSEENFDIVGEELINVCETELKKKRNKLNKVILFGNGGGRSNTFDYFTNKGFNIMGFESVHKEQMKEMIEINL